MISSKNVANAVAGKTARACDSCIRKRARWYCAADDAFLCQACDSSVHSANPLARRHQRVRLKTASLKSLDFGASKHNNIYVPSWHRGVTRKARTPRGGHGNKPVALSQSKMEEPIGNINPNPLVPDEWSDEISHEDNEEEQLLYRVPVFEPSVAELCTSTTAVLPNEASAVIAAANGIESKACLARVHNKQLQNGESLHGFLPSDKELAEFAADVESLLGKGLENETLFAMEELGLVGCHKEEKELRRGYSCLAGSKVKLEEEEEAVVDEENEEEDGEIEADMSRKEERNFELSFDYDSPATCGGEDDDRKAVVDPGDRKESIIKSRSVEHQDDDGDGLKKKKKRKIILSLDYEAVISAWASQGTSPWTTGNRPDFDPDDDCWPDNMGNWRTDLHHSYGNMGYGLRGHPAMADDGGREARVSRYREKRRTRLFSKKIRYEVRKLNAEKRPRMKGRFVKRATFAGGGGPGFPLLGK